MAKDPFLLVSLEESESKALAQVISNDTARKILDLLSKEEGATETEIAKKLEVPLSTVHYNLQALLKANLVQAEEFHYSEKGKEVLHYTLANKLIIIAPKKTNSESFRDKLRSLLPVGAIALGTAGLIQLGTLFGPRLFGLMPPVVAPYSEMTQIAIESGPADARIMTEPVADVAMQQVSQQPIIAFWFLLGALFTMLLLVVWYFFTSKRKD